MHVVLEHEAVIVYTIVLFFAVPLDVVGDERLVSVHMRWTAATGPAHRDALLLVGSGYLEVVIRDVHLLEGSLGFASAHVALFQEMVVRGDQVLAKVKIVVVHPRREDQAAGASAVVVEVLRVLERDQRIFHPVHQEGGTRNLGYLLDVFKSVLDQVL